MKKKIYIAGKITGLPLQECKDKFAAAAIQVEALGFEPVNPFVVVNDDKASWHKAMRLCIAALVKCDGVYLLPCCKTSKGATLEMNIASQVRLPMTTRLEGINLLKWSN